MPGKQKIFITGASSAVMQQLLSRIDHSSFQVIGLTRDVRNETGDVVWIEGDIQDTERIATHLQGCHMVVHAAAVTHARHRQTYFDINVEATERLVKAARKHQVQRFIYISSRTAVPDSGAYGISKMLAEQCVIDSFNKWLVFRLSEIFGPNLKNDFIMQTISAACKRGIALCPVNMPSKLFPIYVDDAAHIMHDMLFKKNVCNEIITINGMEGYSLQELLQCAGEICQKKIKVVPVPKIMMLACAKLLEWLPVNMGIVPDQIPRLYCEKQNHALNYPMLSLRAFLKERDARL